MFNQDPLFQFTDFKWEAHSPRDLITIINNYLNLSKPEITQKRLAAKNFTSRYFSPCTKENIERFEAVHGPIRQDEEPMKPNTPINFGGHTGQA